ncbi:hypothetical protein AD933_01080 [Acetobacter malorum]|uniref:DUF4422 domain-containing protein n=1 Tax=Acetobacter malorum TaxID=178901 RepID=A0A149S2P9_9PROT|nr:DUF4422 domain-containing protein [Acetobacter malorum]KXV20863.1 hypothetical protein AD933_01080 [Acetobacter malorum]
MNLKIYVAGHKEFSPPDDSVYVPMIGGMSNRSSQNFSKDFLGDNTGDNISHLNPYFCELTVQYWIWKNDKQSDIVGLNHYRRFFEKKHYGTNLFYKHINDRKVLFEGKEIAAGEDFDFSEIDMIIPLKYYVGSPLQQYKEVHVVEDLFLIEQQIKKEQPDYIDAYNFYFKNCEYFYHTNMIIAKKHVFDEYSSWIFSLLMPFIDKTFFWNYDTFQSRVFGFLAERLLSVWVLKNRDRFRIEERPFTYPD